MSLGIARGAIEALLDLAGVKRHERSSQSVREDPGAQTRLSQAEALVHSSRLYLYDAINRVWHDALEGREVNANERAQDRLAGSHAAKPRKLTPGEHPPHAITQHIAVHPRVLANTGRVFFGLAPDPTANL